jgi:hypothetical protein
MSFTNPKTTAKKAGNSEILDLFGPFLAMFGARPRT